MALEITLMETQLLQRLLVFEWEGSVPDLTFARIE